MCFSATASFAVGGALLVVGALTLKRAAGNKPRLPYAAIPLLFGIQQSVEGVLWLAIQHDMVLLKSIATYLFTMFSHLIWPAYVPFAIARMEKGMEPWRKKAMWAFRIIGLVVTAHLFVLVTTQPLTAILSEHIVYASPFFYDWPMMGLYIAATCIVAFFSTHPLVRIFGLTVLLFFFVSYWFYTQALFSVWCFFAAALSILVYLHFWRTPA